MCDFRSQKMYNVFISACYVHLGSQVLGNNVTPSSSPF